MGLDPTAVATLVEFVERGFHEWTGFSDPRFVKEERDYKLATREKAVGAEGLLRSERLEILLKSGEFDTIVGSLESLGHDNNLLYQSVPTSGDLSILYVDHLDREAFVRQMLDLLYGDGPSEQRLDRYVSWVTANDLPNKWTFPTYFLYICFDGEMFVKPQATEWFLGQLGVDPGINKGPSGERYAVVQATMKEVKDVLASLGKPPADWIDLQSFLWASYSEAKDAPITPKLREHFRDRFAECIGYYTKTSEGSLHTAAYDRGRAAGRAYFEAIVAAADRGEDVTDLVLTQLLPHTDSKAHREQECWIHIAPSINGTVRTWFEASGVATADAWPKIAKAILGFLRACAADPSKLNAACTEFAANPLSKGFQQGMLSPALNALRPDDYLLINNKSRRVLNYFSGRSFDQNLAEYPAVNAFELALVAELHDEIADGAAELGIRPSDAFDAFCHWLIAVEKDPLVPTTFWRIAPGTGAQLWSAWNNGGYISVGWDEFGNLAPLDKSAFLELQKKLVADLAADKWTQKGSDQAWTFAKSIRPGDRIVANQGTSQVLGVGTVIDEYHFVPDLEHGHRIPVAWDEVGTRVLPKPHPGWERTLAKMKQEEFESILELPVDHSTSLASPLSDDAAFTPQSRDLLEQLSTEPTQAFYAEHKQQLQDLVEQPLRSLLQGVVQQLPPAIPDAMETKTKLYGRIPKNDWGRGGAWDFYWGALYPKGGKRITDAQLYLLIEKRGLRFGFAIGDYGGSQRKLLAQNCSQNADALLAILGENFADSRFHLSPRRAAEGSVSLEMADSITFEQWVEEEGTNDPHVFVALDWDELLGVPRADVVAAVVDTYRQLFPFALLAISEDPLPLIDAYLGGVEEPVDEEANEAYSREDLAKDTSLDPDILDRWIRAIERKQQAIIYGPPGTGKTFVAELLAKHLIAGGHGESKTVQFHPAYAYEDFIQGIRPRARDGGGLDYPVVPGRFLQFCETARNHEGTSVLIIDEINRANLARVFGELMYLLEYRDQTIPLAAGGKSFGIPDNVRIIGTMNTADRSIALVDHALRRRFAFLELRPHYDVLEKYHETTGFDPAGLIEVLKRLNKRIADHHYEVGISFFMREDLATQLPDIWEMEIEPYLEEFFFDRPDTVDEFRWEKIAELVLKP